MARQERKNSDEERSLIDRMRHGDRQALEDFYQRYYVRLYSLIYYQVGGNQADAEDVLQDTLLAAIDSLHTFQGQSRLYSWLCGIAWHKAADLRRHRSGTLLTAPKDPGELQRIDLEMLPEEILQRQEIRNLVHQILYSLPDHYRQVLILKYVEGFSVQEIAQLMGRSFKSIESLLTRARNAFRTALQGMGGKNESQKRCP